MLINVGELVRGEMLTDACRKVMNSFDNVASLRHAQENLYTTHELSPLERRSLSTENKLLNLYVLKTNIMSISLQ